ncbi:MAG: alpha/beta fold hydrolase [Betaproteobacteria bacterium]|nr:alpha/beta fold hydrolase [Betaproteobacteria bacterium]
MLAFVTAAVYLLLAATAACAQGIKLEPKYFKVDEFVLESGQSIRNMVVEYATLGEPRKDIDGNIANAVVSPHGWSGNYAQTVALAKDLVGAGKPLDPQKYFIIFPTALGSPGSSSPSVSGMGAKFPRYTVGDMINAQYRLVTEGLGIKRLAGVMGISMGGYQTLQWITQYPDMMDWAVPIAASLRADGRNLGIFGVMSYTITTDPAYRDGDYKEQPKEAMRRAFMGTYLWYFGAEYYRTQFRTEEQALKGLADAGLGSDKMDANDIVWRNNAMAVYNVTAKLPQVQAEVLVVGVDEDELFPPKEGLQPIAAGIKGANLFTFSSPLGHIGSAVHIGKAVPAINAFLKRVESR